MSWQDEIFDPTDLPVYCNETIIIDNMQYEPRQGDIIVVNDNRYKVLYTEYSPGHKIGGIMGLVTLRRIVVVLL